MQLLKPYMFTVHKKVQTYNTAFWIKALSSVSLLLSLLPCLPKHMYIYMHTCAHAHSHTHAHTHTHSHKHMHTHAQTHMDTHSQICTHPRTEACSLMHTHTQARAHSRTNTHAYTFTHTHTPTHASMLTHARTHTHTHTQPAKHTTFVELRSPLEEPGQDGLQDHDEVLQLLRHPHQQVVPQHVLFGLVQRPLTARNPESRTVSLSHCRTGLPLFIPCLPSPICPSPICPPICTPTTTPPPHICPSVSPHLPLPSLPRGRTSSVLLSLQKDCGLWTLSLTINEILKWLSSLPILMQESFWHQQWSNRYITSLSPPPPHTPPPPSLISLTASVDVKHYVYLLQPEKSFWWW